MHIKRDEWTTVLAASPGGFLFSAAYRRRPCLCIRPQWTDLRYAHEQFIDALVIGSSCLRYEQFMNGARYPADCLRTVFSQLAECPPSLVVAV